MSILRSVVLATVALALSGQTSQPKYAPGQVWEYQTRPQDAGSLIKIQQVSDLGNSKVYHISIVGVHFATRGIAGILPHIPVSDATLNASVRQRSVTHMEFPTTASQDGISEWEKAKGGVFTIPVSRIIDIIDEQTAHADKANTTNSNKR